MDKSPHWPGVGKYVGKIDDFMIKAWWVLKQPGRLDTKPWHLRRVYQDELDRYNNPEITCNPKTI